MRSKNSQNKEYNSYCKILQNTYQNRYHDGYYHRTHNRNNDGISITKYIETKQAIDSAKNNSNYHTKDKGHTNDIANILIQIIQFYENSDTKME